MTERITRHVRALAVVGAVRVALWLFPYASVSAACARVHEASPTPLSTRPAAVGRIVVAVHRMARLVPGATCLTQALAAQRLLGRAGIGSDLRFGVARDASRLGAHAWLEVEGRTVIGETPRVHTPLRRDGSGDVG